MNITAQKQLIFYAGSVSLNISSLPNVSKIDTIYKYSNGSPVSWISDYPEFLQGFTTLEPNTGYLIISKDTTTYPYVLTSLAQNIPTSITISSLLQIAIYNGDVAKNLSTDTAFTNKIDKIFRYVNSSPQDWTNGVPEFLQGFTTLTQGNVYLFDSNNIPYNLYTSATTTSTTTTTTTPAPINLTYAVGTENDYLFFDSNSPSIREYFDLISTTYDIVDMSISTRFLLFLTRDGSLYSVGTEDYAVGAGTLDKSTPFLLGGNRKFKSISAGARHSLAVSTDGTLWAFGVNTNYQLGQGNTTQYSGVVQIGTDNNWSKVAAGFDASYAIKLNGTLWYWGPSANSVFGVTRQTPTQYGVDNGYQEISTNIAGSSFLLTIKNNQVLSIGNNAKGQLGIGTTANKTSFQFIRNVHATNRKIVCGTDHAFILDNGTLYGFGNNQYFKLQNSTTTELYSPEVIFTGVKDVTAGAHCSLIIQNNQIYFAGLNGIISNRSNGGTLLTLNEMDGSNDYIPWRASVNTANDWSKVYSARGSTSNLFAIRPNSNNFVNKVLYTGNNKIDLTNFKRQSAWTDGTDLSNTNFFAIHNTAHKLYAADTANNRIHVMNLLTGTQIKTISTGISTGPSFLLVNPGLNRLYCVNTSGDSIITINTTNDTIIQTTIVGDVPTQACIGHQGKIYISCRASNEVNILSPDGNFIGGFIANPQLLGLGNIPYGPYSITYDPQLNKIYTGNYLRYLEIQLDNSGNYQSATLLSSLPTIGVTSLTGSTAPSLPMYYFDGYFSIYPTVDTIKNLEYFATTNTTRLIKIRNYIDSKRSYWNTDTTANTMAIYTP